jgi:hypothetical protein
MENLLKVSYVVSDQKVRTGGEVGLVEVNAIAHCAANELSLIDRTFTYC